MESARACPNQTDSGRRSVKTIPLITEIQRFCLQDGPGIRTTVFMKGCPLRCPWCHNPETQNRKKEFYYYPDRCTRCGRCAAICPTGASSMVMDPRSQPVLRIDRLKCDGCMRCVNVCLSEARATVGREFTLEEVLRESLSDLPFYSRSGGGVTLSGGDPLVFPEFTFDLAGRLKEEGVHVAMETSCFAEWHVLELLLSRIDLFIVDIKSMNPEKHKHIVGWPLEPILRNIRALIEVNANVRIHLPVIPGFNDSTDDFHAWVEFLAPFAGRLTGVDLLPYHAYGAGKYVFLGRGDSYHYKDIEEIPPQKLVPLAKALIEVGVGQVSVGGLVGMGKERGLKPNERR